MVCFFFSFFWLHCSQPSIISNVVIELHSVPLFLWSGTVHKTVRLICSSTSIRCNWDKRESESAEDNSRRTTREEQQEKIATDAIWQLQARRIKWQLHLAVQQCRLWSLSTLTHSFTYFQSLTQSAFLHRCSSQLSSWSLAAGLCYCALTTTQQGQLLIHSNSYNWLVGLYLIGNRMVKQSSELSEEFEKRCNWQAPNSLKLWTGSRKHTFTSQWQLSANIILLLFSEMAVASWVWSIKTEETPPKESVKMNAGCPNEKSK